MPKAHHKSVMLRLAGRSLATRTGWMKLIGTNVRMPQTTTAAVAALVAALYPAWRAARTPLAQGLREE